ncbi:MAG: hypothetical protein IT211_10105 [Armatimonadetes bacterium]|nr:hypothetical protein [Armatimonadota bacterium]
MWTATPQQSLCAVEAVAGECLRNFLYYKLSPRQTGVGLNNICPAARCHRYTCHNTNRTVAIGLTIPPTADHHG